MSALDHGRALRRAEDAQRAEAARRTLDAAISEKDFMATIVGCARLHGWHVYHPFDSRRSGEGYPDLTLVRERILWLELKTETGTVADEQLAWLDALSRAGAEAFVVRPRDWDWLQATLARDPKGERP